jgi:hypothetical protein
MHLTPGMSYETVQRHAHNLGVSLRQTIQQSVQPETPKFPPGVNGSLPRGGSVQSVNSTETADLEDHQSFVDDPTMAALETALENTHTGNSYSSPSGTLSGPSCQSWRPPMPTPLPPMRYLYPLEGGRAQVDRFDRIPLPVREYPNQFYVSFAMRLDIISPNALGYLPYSNERQLPTARLISATARQLFKIFLRKVCLTVPRYNTTC